MRYGVIYKENLARSRSVIVEALSFEALSQNPALDFIDPGVTRVEAVVDFDGRRVIRSGMSESREIVAMVDPEMGRIDSGDYVFWLRQSGCVGARAAVVDSYSEEDAMRVQGIPFFGSSLGAEVWVDSLIDFKEQAIRPVAMKEDGTVIEVWDGDFGERTPGEWFEREAAGLNEEQVNAN
jgi:hypothetical protein